MKKILAISALAALCLLTGCDFFRTLAGRPTSADIAAKRALIERTEQQEAARRDSIQRVEQQILASIAFVCENLSLNFSKPLPVTAELRKHHCPAKTVTPIAIWSEIDM